MMLPTALSTDLRCIGHVLRCSVGVDVLRVLIATVGEGPLDMILQRQLADMNYCLSAISTFL